LDEWSLDADDKMLLDEVAAHLAENPDVVVEIQGHTDTSGPMRWNMTLSEWRAASAKKYLIERGVAEDRMTTVGLGPNDPAFPNDTRADRAKNRRVTFKPAWK
jgi:OOP family OmpA-OmpF porin